MRRSSFVLILAALTLFPRSAAGDSTRPEISPPPLSEIRPQHGEAYIWYLLHTGHAVRTETKLLIFDYISTRRHNPVEPSVRSISHGWINPEEIKDLDVYVFVSHSHTDHFDSTIFTWQNTVPNITYFFGWDAAEGSRYHNLVGPRATYSDSTITIHTINSHHSGVPEVAYLVQTDGLAIYHGGDYNSDYENDVAYLCTHVDQLDIAMLNDWCGDPILEVINRLKPRLVFPGHFGDKEHEPRRLPGCVCQGPESFCTLHCPTHRGEMFHYAGASQ
ncbi:MAG TPA: MBL fold metallo-hydrolase [Acidobacteriota bacterium]|nr:MBL fold metallo-hydrolase [Acidobacteriota bacterium]